jgi:D-3-phosphoglycerate dehydrogenase
MLSAMTLGIVGLGRLGSLVASYGSAFGMKVYYYSPNSVNSNYERCETLMELAEKSDIVSLHAHYTPETEGLVNKEFFEAMKQGSFIVNTARGKLIDEKALLEALERGVIGGATLDVLADEYEPDFELKLKENPLIKYANSHDNLILTPHCGGATIDARRETQIRTIELIIESIDFAKKKA